MLWAKGTDYHLEVDRRSNEPNVEMFVSCSSHNKRLRWDHVPQFSAQADQEVLFYRHRVVWKKQSRWTTHHRQFSAQADQEVLVTLRHRFRLQHTPARCWSAGHGCIQLWFNVGTQDLVRHACQAARLHSNLIQCRHPWPCTSCLWSVCGGHVTLYACEAARCNMCNGMSWQVSTVVMALISPRTSCFWSTSACETNARILFFYHTNVTQLSLSGQWFVQ